MAEKPTPDRFDDIPTDSQRRGVHRAPRKGSKGFAAFAWSALATLLLTVAGVAALMFFSPNFSFKDFSRLLPIATETPTTTPKPTAAPTVDPASIVNVLNATGQEGMATQVGTELANAGITIGTKSNASETVEHTMIYYVAPGLEGAARGVQQALGAGEVDLSDAYVNSSAQITVVLGQDLLAPATATPTPTN